MNSNPLNTRFSATRADAPRPDHDGPVADAHHEWVPLLDEPPPLDWDLENDWDFADLRGLPATAAGVL